MPASGERRSLLALCSAREPPTKATVLARNSNNHLREFSHNRRS